MDNTGRQFNRFLEISDNLKIISGIANTKLHFCNSFEKKKCMYGGLLLICEKESFP